MNSRTANHRKRVKSNIKFDISPVMTLENNERKKNKRKKMKP